MNDETSFRRVTFKAHSTLFEEGDAADAAYLLSDGLVVLIRGRDRLKLATLGGGEVVGEMALFDDRPRMAKAHARHLIHKSSRHKGHNRKTGFVFFDISG